jgi:hypothetical protein
MARGADGARMSASSSRITIAPVDGSRPLSDRLIDRLLGWWDLGTGRIRRALRTLGVALGVRLQPFLARPLVATVLAPLAAGATAIRRGLGKAFAPEVSPATQRRAGSDVPETNPSTDAPAAPRPAIVARPATGEIRTPLRTPTGEIRTPTRAGTGEIRLRTASITRPEVTPTATPGRTTSGTTTSLRCWSCLQRNRVRAPRRGGCFLCSACNATMLVVDPVVGLTCDVAQAQERGIQTSRQADETDPALGPGDTNGRR